MHHQPDTDQTPIRIGISTCLLGEKVRFDKGHKRDAFVVDTLGQFFSWTPVCPEMEIGLGTPRESLRLIGDSAAPSLIAPKSRSDHTETMHQFANERLAQLEDLELHGYILKKDSPTCGMTRVRVYGNGGIPQRNGQGLFARALMERFPLLPVEEEGRLNDMPLRENFIERVFAYYRWRTFVASHPTRRDVVQFHTQNKWASPNCGSRHSCEGFSNHRISVLRHDQGKTDCNQSVCQNKNQFAIYCALFDFDFSPHHLSKNRGWSCSFMEQGFHF